MPSWTLIETHQTQGRTFRRPLQGIELAFFWGGHLNGVTDNLYHVELRLMNTSRDAPLFSDANIVKAWLSSKRRYPLSGATIQILPEIGGDDVPILTSEPHFVIREHDLAVSRPHEVVFGQVACAEEVPQRIAAIWNGPRPLSDELLAKLYVFRETDSQRAGVLHLITLIAHCVTDGMANRTFMRCLLDTLARGGEVDSKPAQVSLEDRLAMATSLVDLEPTHLRSFSPARLRWRRAICAILWSRRAYFSPGGHTLPCRFTRATEHTLPQTSFISSLLTQEQTTSVIANCRLHGLTFGTAYLALAQVAMTRVLYRRYLRGEISEEEWAYRKREPYRTVAPLNLRPYLEKAWFEKGGGGEFVLSMDVFYFKLPFMTLGETERHQHHKRELLDGAPPFSDLLTFDRFLYRAGLAKEQIKAFIDHPLFFEFIHLNDLTFAQITRLSALEHAKNHRGVANDSGTNGKSDDEVLAVTDMPMTFAHGGSSLGNVQLISPTEYPLPPTHPLSPFSAAPHPARAGYAAAMPPISGDSTPRIVVENAMTRLHVRSAELYLGALTSRGQLNMYVSYDANVYEDEVVREWLNEVKGAVLWYLGQTHRSRRELRSSK